MLTPRNSVASHTILFVTKLAYSLSAIADHPIIVLANRHFFPRSSANIAVVTRRRLHHSML
jgi:hypothetical protein